MKIYNEGIRARKRASDRVIRENGGYLPIDYEDKVEEYAAPELDALANRFKTEGRGPEEGGFSLNPLDIILGK